MNATLASESSATGLVATVRLVRLPIVETAVGTIRPVHETAVGTRLLARVVEVNLRILLTSAAAMLGALPIFAGLAWTLIFGLFASKLFTLFVVPVVYWLLYGSNPRSSNCS